MTALQQRECVPTPVRPNSLNASTLEEMDIEDGSLRLSPQESPRASLANDISFGSGPQWGDTRIVVIMHGHGQDKIVDVFAEVLGKPFRTEKSFQDVSQADRGLVVGILADNAKADIAVRDKHLVVAINAHCVTLGMPPDLYLSAQCDYEFLYTETPLCRRYLSRFIAHTLGQLNHFETLLAKPRTFFISTTFPHVHAALPNIDILTVGSDAVELRVDLLKEPLGDNLFSAVPSLSYVGEQVMLLRQRTELPIIFTTRCTRENGRFPMADPELYHDYLYRAIQWGVEYIDVELWLPVCIRKRLYERRGSSRIMSTFHDFSGSFKWTSKYAQDVFIESGRYADIINMIVLINDHNDNFELEYFRSKIRTELSNAPPLSAVNMGETGQFSRTLNKFFTPITHPLLPIIAAPGQMSAAEINQALTLLGQLPKKSIYGIMSPSAPSAVPQAPFFEKCFNELGLPHHFAVVERQAKTSCVDAWCNQKNFGGAYLSPPVSLHNLISNSPFFAAHNGGAGPALTEAARIIGMIDTIVVRPSPTGSSSSATASVPSSPQTHPKTEKCSAFVHHPAGLPPNSVLVLDNSTWRGILSTLTRDLAPSAYYGRAAVVVACSSEDAASVIYALQALRVAKIYTVGFRTPASLAKIVPIEPFNNMESLQRARMIGPEDRSGPFVIVSALGPEKGALVSMLLRVFGSRSGTGGKVFLDLAETSVPRRADPGVVAEQSGFTVFSMADVAAFTTVETLKLLVGQNVPYSFVRLASGRGMY